MKNSSPSSLVPVSVIALVSLIPGSALGVSALGVSAARAADSAKPGAKGWTWKAEDGKGAVTFDAIGRPSALKIHGKGDLPKGTLTIASHAASGALTFELESLDTGIKMRNEHMKKKYLETDKHGTAKLLIKELKVPVAIEQGDATVESMPFTGTLTLHGVDQPVNGNARLERKGENLTVDARFDLKTDDYKISTPSFAGITMNDVVKVEVLDTAPLKPSR